MSGRGATAAFIAAANADSNRPLHLYEFHFDSGTTYVNDGYRDIAWNGHTYLARGSVLDYSGVAETADLQVIEARVSLSGVDQVYIAGVLLENVLDRQLVIYKAFLNANEAVIVDPVAIFDGRMDAPVISEDAPEMLDGQSNSTSGVSVSATSHFVDFERTPGRRTNHEEQQIYFPGDNGFEYVSGLNREIIWGRAGNNPALQKIVFVGSGVFG